MSTADDRLVLADVLAALGEPVGEPVVEPVAEPGEAAPLTSTTPLTTIAGLEVGLWDMGLGTDTDVEVDEVFLVLAGSGRVTFSDGSHLELRPGVLVRLAAGDATTWVVDQPLRKLYLA